MPLKKLLFLFLLISSPILHGQSILKSIDFQGNKKTKTDFLETLLKSKVNETYSSITVQNDLESIRRLPGIAVANVEISTAQDSISVLFKLTERLTILPILDLGGLSNNLWFSIGLLENNLKGRGNNFLAFYQNNNGRHGGQIYFRHSLSKDLRWAFSTNARRWASEEPLFFSEGPVNYIYTNHSLGVSLIRKFDWNKQLELGSTLFQEIYSQSEDQVLSVLPGPERLQLNKLLSLVQIEIDNKKYDRFYRKGYYFKGQFQNVYGYELNDWFNSVQIEFIQFFRPYNKLNIASRLKLGLSTNNASPFAPFVADSQFNLRGIGNRIDRGTGQVVFNIEFRYTTTQHKNWASQIVAFADLGTWRNPGGTLKELTNKELFRQFVGFGSRIIFKKVFGATLRIDYGVNITNIEQHGFVLGLGQYF